MTPQIASFAAVLLGVGCALAAVCLLVGWVWTLLLAGVLLTAAGLLLPWPSPKPDRPRRFDGAVP